MTTLMPEVFKCSVCNYVSYRKYDYDRHMTSIKHAKTITDKDFIPYKCDKCLKTYKHHSSLWNHKKKCDTMVSPATDITVLSNLVLEVMKNNTELQKQMFELCKTSTTNNSSHHVTNSNNMSNNKTFNLQFFLNETCKDAMNIMDFVDSLQVQLTDLESVGELGFVNGIAKLIIKNLNALDETERPVHCSDLKRETMYVKDENKWEKADSENTKMKKALRHVARKNTKLIPVWKEKHPDCRYSSSHLSDQYNHIILESMGGSGDNDEENASKILTKIAKEVVIKK